MLLFITFLLGSGVKLHVLFLDFHRDYSRPQYAFLRTTSFRFAAKLSELTKILREHRELQSRTTNITNKLN